MSDRFLLDNVTLSRLTSVQRSSSFVRDRCRIPTAVLAEAQGLPDATELAALEYETTGEVLRKVAAVVRALEPGDHMLDLFRNEGNGDVFLLAVALVEADIAAQQLFADRWVIATDDKGLRANSSRWQVATCTSAEFAELID